MIVKMLELVETGQKWGGKDMNEKETLLEACYITGHSLDRITRHLNGELQGLYKGSRPNAHHFRWVDVEIEDSLRK